LLRLLASPDMRAAMGRAGRARIESELNWNELARRFDALYKDGGLHVSALERAAS